MQKTEKSKFAQMEEAILEFWEKNKIFEKSVERDAPNGDYVFYDGPPFATGTPHYGHIVASTMKDVVPRYWTMKGYRVERKWGWDCHGLPIENIVEQELKLKSKKDIEKVGIEKFNETCRSKVLLYVDEWKKVMRRLGRWADMENAYKTMDKDYMESIWWVFKQLWDNGYIYKDYKSMHICPRCETTLSQSEVTEGYKDISDLSLTAKFELVDEPGTYILAWTTTPWTLIGNVALAVGPTVKYIKVEHEGRVYILAKELLEQTFGDKKYKVAGNVSAKELVGKKYKPLFDYFVGSKLVNMDNAYQVVAADFVSTKEGTGVVHIAPAFGEDDMNLGKEKNLPFIQHVQMDGKFSQEVKDWPGENVKPIDDVKATDKKIIEYLDKKGLVFASSEYTHSYPHCWRCETPLLNYATSSWFVNVLKVKERLLELAKNINWVPEHIKEGRFGKWLEGAKDWSISRQRFWGSVMPIWVCEKCGEQRVFGSIKELEEASGEKVEDLHKHVVDRIIVPCQCGQPMHRIPDVLDCWFESGSMPYAQMHYPFENKDKFEKNFPAQFIAEGADQCRAWFYYLHVIAGAIKKSVAYKNVIVNGIVLAEDGQKMSKRLKNYPDPMEIMDKYCSDAMRLYLLMSPVMKADTLCFSEKGVDEAYKKVVMLLWNVYSFYGMYAGDEVRSTKYEVRSTRYELQKLHILDRWILAKLNVLIKEATEAMDGYDLVKGARPFVGFVDDLSTWYLRRSRDRFKTGDEGDKQVALETLHEVLLTLSKVLAPFAPFIAENLYQKITNNSRINHLSDPETLYKFISARLMSPFGPKAPFGSETSQGRRHGRGQDLKDELPHELDTNCESVHLCEWPRADEKMIDEKLLAEMGVVRQIVEAGLAARAAEGIKVRQPLAFYSTSLTKNLSEQLSSIVRDELNIKELRFGEDKLETELTPELKQEGLLREMVRSINALRKEAGLTIKDRVKIYYQTDNQDILGVFEKFEEELKKATLSDELICGKGEVGGKMEKEVKVGESSVKIALETRTSPE